MKSKLASRKTSGQAGSATAGLGLVLMREKPSRRPDGIERDCRHARQVIGRVRPVTRCSRLNGFNSAGLLRKTNRTAFRGPPVSTCSNPKLPVDNFRVVAQTAEHLTGPLGQDLGRFWHVSGSDGQHLAAKPDQREADDDHAQRGDGNDRRERAT